MAYNFVAASSQNFEGAINDPGRPATIFIKLKIAANFTGFLSPAIAGIDTTGGTRSTKYFAPTRTSGRNAVALFLRAPSIQVEAISSNGVSLNTWTSVSGKDISSSVRTVNLENTETSGGGNLGATVITVNNFNIGAIRTTSLGDYFNGQLAEFAIWDIELSADDCRSLNAGFKPFRVRPQNLKYYVPLVRDVNELRTNVSITTSASAPTVTEHPRVY